MSTYPAEVGVQVATVVQIEVAALRRDLAAKQLAGDRALALLVERMLNLTGASGAAVALARETEMVCRASAGDAPGVGACIDPNSGLSFECLRTGRLVRCDDTETDSRADRSVCRGLLLRSIMIVPVVRQGRAEGVLEVFSPRPYAFESGDELILDQLADLVAEIALGKASGQDHIVAKPAEVTPAASPAIARQSSANQASPKSPPPALKTAPHAAAPAPPAEPPAKLSTAKIVASAAAGLRDQLFSSRIRTAGAGVLLVVLSLGAWQGLRSKTPASNQGPQLTPFAAAATPAVSETAPVVVRETLRVKPIVIADRPTKKPATPITLRPPEVAAAPSPMMAFAQPADVSFPLSTVLSAPVATPRLDREKISHVSGGKLLNKVAPVYPRSLAQGVQGEVVLKATINRQGQVSKVSLVRGPAVLAQAAIAAVLRWRYQPFLLDGAPTEVENEIIVNFTLPGQ